MVNPVDSETQPKSNPRVSFNRDVHVKRYGSQLNHNDSLNHDSLPSRSQSPANFRRLLPDLSDEALEREAALVLEQANYFGSLPHRKNSHRKPIRRSISDASKKSKRNSIFNIFNSTPTSTNSPSPVINKKTINEKHAINKKVERSKSDVSSQTSKSNRGKLRNPIHLNANAFNNILTNSSDSSDNNNAFLTSTPKFKAPLTPITEVNSPLSDVNSHTDYFDEKPTKGLAISNGKEFFNEDLIPTTDKMTSKYSKSVETVHSSQMPAERPTLTKGATVNKMIKRLSIERLSPPPTVIQAGGFSYTNPSSPPAYSPTKPLPPFTLLTKSEPSNDIVYAQVVCNSDGSKKSSSKETVHNKNRQASPPSSSLIEKPIDSVDHFITTASSPSKGTSSSYQFRNSVKIVPDYERDEVDNGVTDDEPFIKPNIRYTAPRYNSNTNINNNNFINEFDNHNEMRDNEFDGLDMTLSSRREILESRIKSRIGGLHHNNGNDNSKTFVQNHIRRTSSSPPTTTKRYHKYGSNEIIDRYSPEHVELIHSRSPSYERQGKSYVDSTLRKKSHSYSKHDKGDSGIEVDNVAKNNKKNKHSLGFSSSRFNIGRKWNYEDDIIECELFLMKEKKHTEETYPFQLVRTFVYRERSIDDGSHYDPNLDKANIIKEWKHNKKLTRDFLKSKKKKSGLDKVKDLFKSKPKSNGDDEVRSRYREYSPNLDPPPIQQNIAHRRRLSTPTASPAVTNRSKSLPPKGKKLNGHVAPSNTLKNDKENNGQKFNWFASLERLSKKKAKEPPQSVTSTIDRSSTISRNKSTSMKNISSNGSSKTLRFFGDTDGDESISRAASRKLSSSNEDRLKSSSLQNLNAQRKMKQTKSVSRSRAELQNISESTSDTDAPQRRMNESPPSFLPPPRPPKSTKLVSAFSSTLPRPPRRKMYEEEENEREYSHREENVPYYQKKENFETDSLSNLTSARRLRESLSVSRENLQRDRFDSDASQRSVVYLHAGVVGDIQPSMTIDRRRPSTKNSMKSSVRDEYPVGTSMRTVNRSVSMSAPWKPKFMTDGYEINYNNDVQRR